MKFTVFFLLIISFSLFAQEETATLSGYVKIDKNSLALNDVNVIINGLSIGTTTDSSGFYSIKIPPGKNKITFSCIGYESVSKEINISGSAHSVRLDIVLTLKIYQTNEVSVRGNKIVKPISLQEIKEKDLTTMPNLYSDVIRGVKILPGVTSNNELTNAYNVRGGGNFDENLIYLNVSKSKVSDN